MENTNVFHMIRLLSVDYVRMGDFLCTFIVK